MTETYKQQLIDMRDELSQRLEKIRADLSQGRSKDSEEQAIERENDDVLDGLARDAATELNAVERALQRLENGQYGYCLHCHEPIAEHRLASYPAAEYCIECAEEIERRRSIQGGS